MKTKIWFLALALAAMLPCAAMAAEDYSGRVISDVAVDGLQRVSEPLVRAQIEIKSGQVINPRAIARDIRRLYDMGHFTDISADVVADGQQVKLTYIFREKRVIGELRIVGNRKIKERKIRGVLTFKEGASFDEASYDQERDAILKLYRSKGFMNTSVDIVVDEISPARVRVTYQMNEGRRARIRSVAFEGNDTISDAKLRKLMKTKRAWWFLGGRLDDEKLEADLKNIVDEYGNHGRLEAEISGTDMGFGPKGRRMDLTIRVAEGPEYHVSELETSGNKVYDDDEVLQIIKVKAGDIHNKGQVQKDAEEVQKGYRDSGYVNAETTAQVMVDKETKTTRIVLSTLEDKLKYLREIKITGNTTTKDKVIRRELLLLPSERYDGSAVEASKRRLENSRYYDAVRISVEDLPTQDLYSNLQVDVDEGKTGSFNFGGGYSSEERFNTFAELKLDNFDIGNWKTFSGAGQQLVTRVSLGQIRSNYSISFTEPEFLGYPLALGTDVFNESYRYTGGIEYEEETTGGQLRLGKNLSQYVTGRTALRYTYVNVADLPDHAAPDLRREEGSSDTLASIWGIERNTLDVYTDPSTGAKHDLTFTVAGFSFDHEFTKIEHDSSWYFPLTDDKKWIFSWRTREGVAQEYGSSEYVPISERFFCGGSATVRGYDFRDIGPKQQWRYWWRTGEYAVGGKLRIVENFELKYKVLERLRLYWFVDAGGVWQEPDDFDPGDLKFSTGLGFGVDIPRMGPIRVDYGVPINPDKGQGRGRLHLFTGFRF